MIWNNRTVRYRGGFTLRGVGEIWQLATWESGAVFISFIRSGPRSFKRGRVRR